MATELTFKAFYKPLLKREVKNESLFPFPLLRLDY